MTELATIDQSVDIAKWADTLVFARQLAEVVADTEFVPTALRRRPEAITALICYGAEVGVSPMAALQGIHIVEGRPAPSAELMRAMILRAGHSLGVHEMSGTRCRISGRRRDETESDRLVVEWTLDMARAAGLLGRNNWRNYPRAMLFARATSDLARAKFPDVVKGLGYVAEDADTAEAVEAWGPPEVESPVTPKRKPIQRRRKSEQPPPVAPPLPSPGATTPVPPANGGATPEPLPTDPPRTPSNVPYAGYRDEDEPLPSHMLPEPLEDALPPLPDELEPEQPAPEPTTRLVAGGLMKALQAGLTEQLGTAATREERHALLAAILGREIVSSKELTRNEAGRVMEMFERFDNGTARHEFDFDAPDDKQPAIKITDLREPPDE